MKQNKRDLKLFKFGVVKLSLLLALILMIASWMFVYKVDHADFLGLFSAKNAFYSKKFLKGLLGIGAKSPAFLSIDSWQVALKLTYETLQMSIMAIGFATLGMIFTVIPAARNATNGTLTVSKKWYSQILFGIIRSAYIFSRAIPELVWAMIIIFVFKPGILAGALALGIYNFGILGKLCTEVVEDLDLKPIRNLASCGAGTGQILLYGIIPTVMPKFMTFIFYRWEVIIRTPIVVGFVGAGGLGQQFKFSMSYFQYSELSLLLICYLLLVAFADLLSEGSRRAIR